MQEYVELARELKLCKPKEDLIKGDKFIRTESYYETLRIMRILEEGLEDIATDTMSEGKMVETAIETLQSMEDKCKQSNWRTTNLIPEKLWEMD